MNYQISPLWRQCEQNGLAWAKAQAAVINSDNLKLIVLHYINHAEEVEAAAKEAEQRRFAAASLAAAEASAESSREAAQASKSSAKWTMVAAIVAAVSAGISLAGIVVQSLAPNASVANPNAPDKVKAAPRSNLPPPSPTSPAQQGSAAGKE